VQGSINEWEYISAAEAMKKVPVKLFMQICEQNRVEGNLT
jgi:hypothetical protein